MHFPISVLHFDRHGTCLSRKWIFFLSNCPNGKQQCTCTEGLIWTFYAILQCLSMRDRCLGNESPFSCLLLPKPLSVLGDAWQSVWSFDIIVFALSLDCWLPLWIIQQRREKKKSESQCQQWPGKRLDQLYYIELNLDVIAFWNFFLKFCRSSSILQLWALLLFSWLKIRLHTKKVGQVWLCWSYKKVMDGVIFGGCSFLEK